MVLGISGGQDSTLLGKLAQMAVDELNEEQNEEKYSFHALNLPYGEQADKQDAIDAVEFISPTSVRKINIKASVDASDDALKEAGYELSDFIKGNEKARERMKPVRRCSCDRRYRARRRSRSRGIDRHIRNGDGACDIAPLVGLNKRQGQKCKYLRRRSICIRKYRRPILSDHPMLSDEGRLVSNMMRSMTSWKAKTSMMRIMKRLSTGMIKHSITCASIQPVPFI